MKKIVGLIPSRLSSTRLPGKALADIEGMPVIAHVALRAKLSSCLSDLIVCTDSKKIASVCAEYDVKSILTSSGFQNGTERIASIAKDIDADFIIDIQGDEPLLNPNHIDIVSRFISSSPQVEIVIPTLKVPSNSSDSIVRVQSSISGRVMTLSRARLPHVYAEPSYFVSKHLSIIGFSKSALLKYASLPQSTFESIESVELLRALENDMSVYSIALDGDSFSVDVQDDLDRARAAMSSDPYFQSGYSKK